MNKLLMSMMLASILTLAGCPGSGGRGQGPHEENPTRQREADGPEEESPDSR